MQSFYPLFLANEANDGAGDLPVTDKFHRREFTTVASANDDMLEEAIVSAVAARKDMARLKPYQKQDILRQCAKQFELRADELVKVLIAEGGKPRQYAIGEVKRLISTFHLAADALTTLPQGEVLPLAVTETAHDYRGMTQAVPVGVCAFITPFNFPLNLVAHKIAPAIAAGCPFILKPASSTPVSALIMGEVLGETDLPTGAFSILPMSSDVADTLITDERINLLSFTGSDVVGWDMKRRAGKKKVVLELGGNAAVVVEPDTDLDVCLPRIVSGAYAHAGQVCISVQRVLVHHSIYEETKTKLIELAKGVKMGDPSLDETVIGPMISQKELDRVEQWLADAKAKGAQVECGGITQGMSLHATILTNVPNNAHLYKDEAFAPVLCLEPYDDFASALRTVNASRFGLQVGVYTNDINKILTAWDDIEAGGIVINDIPTFRVDNMPYGGIKDSGLGREGIRYAIEDMTETRLLVIKS